MLNKEHAEQVAHALNNSKKFSSKSPVYRMLRKHAKQDEAKFTAIEYKIANGVKV